jgi:hypothetical protein
MLNLAVDKYAGVLSKVDSKTPEFKFTSQKPRQKNFEEASVVKALLQNDTQWEETCKILI